MDKLKRVSVEHRDNFVAYLDGELSPDESKNLERVLADSPVARMDVELLVRTYDMLRLRADPGVLSEGAAGTQAMADAVVAKLSPQ